MLFLQKYIKDLSLTSVYAVKHILTISEDSLRDVKPRGMAIS